jgi:hypothetical protein
MGRVESKLEPEPSLETARDRLMKDVDRARREGVYEQLRALRGKLHIDLDLEELRKDRD